MKNDLGELRRSHVVSTYGPGAIIDFRAPKSGAPLSGVLAGLDEWDRVSGGRGGLQHPQVIHEARLERRLGVQGFRLPPVRPSRLDRKDFDTVDVLPVVRFPEWLQCPECNRLKSANSWSQEPGEPERWCAVCSKEKDKKIWVVPVRFIAACERGHLAEFPWRRWSGCDCSKWSPVLDTRGPGLAGKVVRCESCDKARSMEGAFSKQAMWEVGYVCEAYSPWIETNRPQDQDRCGEGLRVLQRGASNVYWGDTRSALDIPPFSPDPSFRFGSYWSMIRDANPTQRRLLIQVASEMLKEPADVLQRVVDAWAETQANDPKDEDVRVAEYRQFVRALREPIEKPEFDTRPEPTPAEFGTLFEGVALARRLREVRAQVAFTRIAPPGGMFRAGVKPPTTSHGRGSRGFLQSSSAARASSSAFTPTRSRPGRTSPPTPR